MSQSTVKLIKPKPRRRWWQSIWLWLPVGVLLVVWALRDISLGEVIQVLSGLSLAEILVLMGINLLILVCFSLRWWLIVRAQGYPVPFGRVFLYRLAGFGVNYFTPGPQFGGEPMQVALLNRRDGLPVTTAVASVTLERLVELTINFSFLAFGIVTSLQFPIFTFLPAFQLMVFGMVLLVFPLGYLLILWLGRTPLGSLLHWLVKQYPLPQAIQTFSGFVYSSERQVSVFCRQNPVPMAAAVLVSLAGWVLMVVEFGVTVRFIGLELPFAQLIAVMTAARLAFLAPTPGGLGALESALVLAVSALGSAPAYAVSLVLLIRARDISLGALGLVWLSTSAMPGWNRTSGSG